eukprot:3040388-Amphidinium_carterae.1
MRVDDEALLVLRELSEFFIYVDSEVECALDMNGYSTMWLVDGDDEFVKLLRDTKTKSMTKKSCVPHCSARVVAPQDLREALERAIDQNAVANAQA